MAEEKQVNGKLNPMDKGYCTQCGSANCTCSGKSCPFGKTDKVLCLILKVVKIIVFIGLAFVLFDIHGMMKQAEKTYAAASANQMQPMQGPVMLQQAPVATTQH